MRNICLILILGFTALVSQKTEAAPNPKVVRCEGPIRARTMSGKTFDEGQAKMVFIMRDTATMKSIQVVTRFKKIKAQSIEAFESHANKRVIAAKSGQANDRSDFFNIGNNGACQVGLGYQGDLARSQKPVNSWGVFMMGCGNYSVVGNLKCQIK